MAPKPLMSERDAARVIGMSRSFLARGRMEGNPDAPPFYKIGKAVRYHQDDLAAWLDRRRVVVQQAE